MPPMVPSHQKYPSPPPMHVSPPSMLVQTNMNTASGWTHRWQPPSSRFFPPPSQPHAAPHPIGAHDVRFPKPIKMPNMGEIGLPRGLQRSPQSNIFLNALAPLKFSSALRRPDQHIPTPPSTLHGSCQLMSDEDALNSLLFGDLSSNDLHDLPIDGDLLSSNLSL